MADVSRFKAILFVVVAISATAGVSSASAADPVIAAAGDIACDPGSSNFNGGNGTSTLCRQKATSDLMVNAGLTAVLPLGDNQYYCGGLSAFLASYAPSWGRVKAITFPAVGNHEYLTSGGTGCDSTNTGASGYFKYFGAVASPPKQGYYSYNIGAWHLISLNSQCSQAGGCGSSSPQGVWLRSDLAAHPNQCLLAYWHIPLFSSGGRANSNSRSFWDALYAAGADVVLAGHDHIYERFAPQTPTGAADATRGVREFIVGTGGADHTSLASTAANSQVRNTSTYGVLDLTLSSDHYAWRFVPEAGHTFADTGSQNCHHASSVIPDSAPPSAPANLAARVVSGSQVDLSWSANVGVAGYRVFRGSTQIATTTTTSYSDTGVQPNTSYQYHVVAYDFANNPSGSSNTVSATTPAPTAVLTFTTNADTYAGADSPGTSYGTSTELIADDAPVKHVFVKFSVSGVGTKKVLAAKLRVYCVNASGVGGDFHGTASTWTESSLTWNAQPAISSTIVSSLGTVASGRWYETDVTPLVKADGAVSIAATSTSSDGAHYASKEGAAGFAPQLVVTTG
jgi:calcineurin-like phosphoesterase family protein